MADPERSGHRRMAIAGLVAIPIGVIVVLAAARAVIPRSMVTTSEDGTMIELPAPDREGSVPLETTMQSRRSHRRFAPDALQPAQLGQLLWAAQGCTADGCRRTAPSAGGTYPLTILAVVGKGGVEGLDAGVYEYWPPDHSLKLVAGEDRRQRLADASLHQGFIAQAPATIAIAADHARTARVYGDRATRYVDMEVGHAGQNLYLQAEALSLGTVGIGAFDDAQVASILALAPSLAPLYLMPVGKPLD